MFGVETDPAAVRAVAAQSRKALSYSGLLSGADDARKQQIAEEYYLLALLLSSSGEYFQSNPAQAAPFVAQIKQTGLRAGLDLDSMKLTKKGFVPAK